MREISQLISQLEKTWAPTLGVAHGVRVFRKGLPNKRIFFLNSRKNGGVLLSCEGEIEYRYCLKLEFDNHVDAYFQQPFTLRVSDKNTYTPDLLVRLVSNEYIIVELKNAGSIEHDSVQQLISLAEGHILDQGYSYKVVTEIDLLPDIEHVNRECIYRASPVSISSSTAAHARSILGTNFRGNVLTARERLVAKGFDENIIESLIFSKHLTFNSSLEFDNFAVIRFCYE